MKESEGCGVIDTGCSTTVCGVNWLENYMGFITEYEKSCIKEESSLSTFTFGDGISVNSMKRVTLPCWIGGMKSTVVTDIVDCNIPLLLRKNSLKKAGMCLDFRNDTISTNGKTIQLRSTSSGHYVLPLSL